jgi:hypothetical protein
MTKQEARRIATSQFPGERIYDLYGPSLFGDRTIWEAIVYDKDDELQGRYILALTSHTYETFHDFQALMLEVGKLHNTKANERFGSLVGTCVQAAAFLVAIFVSAYLVLFRENYGAWATAFMFFCIIASSTAMYFGRLITPRIPTMPG